MMVWSKLCLQNASAIVSSGNWSYNWSTFRNDGAPLARICLYSYSKRYNNNSHGAYTPNSQYDHNNIHFNNYDSNEWNMHDAGDIPPCNEITLNEVINAINNWVSGSTTLSEVIDLINAWASS